MDFFPFHWDFLANIDRICRPHCKTQYPVFISCVICRLMLLKAKAQLVIQSMDTDQENL